MTTATDQITREGDGTVEALWANFDLVWTQYQSWLEHDRLLAESQDRLNKTSPDMANNLKQLLGDNSELKVAGQQLRQTLGEITLELGKQKSSLTAEQQAILEKVKIRLERERELRVLSQDRDHNRER